MASRRKGHRWRPIEDLPADWSRMAHGALPGLVSTWQEVRSSLGDTAAAQYQQELTRRWSIETGILERLYTLDEGVTLTLVEQGFDAALVPHDASDLPARRLIDILEDHREAAEGLFAFVKRQRNLSTSYIKELHQLLTRHQETCEAVDSLGHLVEVRLRRGEYKVLKNNPGDPKTGETWHEYCPPEQVESEMDRLVAMHLQHTSVPFEVEAAWLHHRFTQIHPFQDGNGRVARALATLVCIRAGACPLVVARGDKPRYIATLEQADENDLAPLVQLFAVLQQRALIRGIALGDQVQSQHQDLQQIVRDARARLEGALVHRDQALRNHVTRLTERARKSFERVQALVQESLAKVPGVQVRVSASDDDNRYWFKAQIIDTARHFDYYANFAGVVAWVRLQIMTRSVTDLVVCFHQIGRLEDAVAGAVVFLAERARHEEVSGAPFQSVPVSDQVLAITAGRSEPELDREFDEWLERAVRIGLDQWRRSL